MKRESSGFHPFWFWNGDIEKGEIKRQIDLMAEQGIRGFFIHFRQGMTLPYLSEAFFDMVGCAAEYASSRGMTAHIYDEYPYPSGSAGGTVTLGHPEYRATLLRQDDYALSGGEIRLPLREGDILNATLVPLREGKKIWPESRDVTSHAGVVLDEHSFHAGGLTSYNQKRYFASRPVPTLLMTLPEGEYLLCVSVQEEMTRFKYWGTLPDVLNPEAMADFIKRTHGAYGGHYGEKLSSLFYSSFSDELEPVWSTRLPGEYEKTYGESLPPLLPALIHGDFPGADRIRQNFHRLKYTLFEGSYEKPLSSWCRERGIRYCGEKPSLYLRQLKYMDIPGCEPGHTKAGRLPDTLKPTLRGNARACASAAQFYRKEGSLCECYHSLGWSGTLLDARIIAEALVLMGITMLVPHGFFYTTHGLTKHDAPPTFFFQMPYWPLTHVLSDQIAHIQDAFAGTEIGADIFFYEPAGSLPTPEEATLYRTLLENLAGKQLDFLMVDGDIIRDLGQDLKGKTLLVLKTASEEPEKGEALGIFASRGGRVLTLASPEDLDDAGLKPSLEFSLEGEKPDRLWMVTRRGKEGPALRYFLNTGDTPLAIRFPAPRRIGEFLSGAHREYAGELKTIAPFESFLVGEAAEGVPMDRTPFPVAIPETLSARPLGKNYLRLDRWEMELNGRKRMVSASPLINQLEEGRFRWSPEVRTHFGWMPDLGATEMEPVYRLTVRVEDPAAAAGVELMVEPGSLRGEWLLSVNGSAPLGREDLAPREYPVRGTEALPIGPRLKEGENLLELRMKTTRLDDGPVSPLYMAGDFAVNGEDALAAPGGREDCRFEDYRQMGLPYYSGQLLYSFPFAGDREEEDPLLSIETPAPFQEAMEVSLNGGPFCPAPWIPYRLILSGSRLRRGENRLDIRVSTSLIRTFEGTFFDIKGHRYRDC